jgi:hypothetical protein
VSVGLVLLAVIVGLVISRGHSHQPVRIVEIQMRASAGTFAQLFWGSDLEFTEEHSTRIPLEPGSEGFQRLRFFLPPQEIHWIRFDPMDAAGEVLIQRMQLTEANGQVLRTFGADDLRPASQIAAMFQEGERIRLVTMPKGADPFLYASFGCASPVSPRQRLEFVTPATLVLVSLAALGLLAASAIFIGADAFARRSEADMAEAGGTRWRSAVWIAMLFLAVFAGKLLLMREHPATVPFWDQWDAEARVLYVPYSECGLSWSHMFGLHNEHRVFFTRLLALDLLALNRQWDPRLQQVANAVLHSLTAVLLTAMLWLANGRRRLDLLSFLVGLAFALPFAWQNTLFGFQSAFYFLLLFSILGLWLTTRYPALTAPWTLGWLCALCALFTAAGGVLLPPVIALIAVLKLLHDRRSWRDGRFTLAAVALVLIAGVLTASPPLAHHEAFRAKTLMDFTRALGHNLAWPWIENAPVSVLMWLPMLALVAVRVRGRTSTTVIDRFVIALGAWVALQAAAIAYGRGAGGAIPDGRYQDFFSIGFVANAVALGLVVVSGTRERTSARHLAMAGLVMWFAAAAAGLDARVDHALIEVNASQRFWDIGMQNVRRLVSTRDVTRFIGRRPPDIPYPDAQSLATVLQDAYIRRILPSAVRQPLHLEPRSITNAAFAPDGAYPIVPRDPLAHVWGSYTAQGNPAFGRFESQPIECQFGGDLQFMVSGYVGMKRQRLAIKDLGTGRESEIKPSVLPKEDWLRAVVPCPGHPFAVVADDARSDYWLAFREPVELGRLSTAAESAIDASPGLLLAAFALVVLVARRP